MADEPDTTEGVPLETGKVYLARIEDSGETGEGLANLAGHLVFVQGARPGQDVKIEVTKVFGRFAFGKIVK
ncbi:MAG: TRAM domain-containing protein [Thermoplasmata archaeon]|nr:TRAM domain-containing protein [Thermoplasmata archaeon]